MAAWLDRLFRRPPQADWVEPDGLRRRLTQPQPALVVDVRGPEEFTGPLGHIEGARNIPLPELGAHAGELTASGRPVVLVCLTDVRSSKAALELKSAGIRDVSVLRRHEGVARGRGVISPGEIAPGQSCRRLDRNRPAA